MRLAIEADGGSRGNPGPAGYGAVVTDDDTGEVLAERAAGLGRATNNVAEYQGLIAGLTAAGEIAAGSPVDSLLVRMDSKLVVEQMSGRWKVKHPDMIPLARTASALVRALPMPVRFQWIPRERNKHADRLANEAMDAQASGHVWEGETEASLPIPIALELDLTSPGSPAVPARGWSSSMAGTTATTTVLLRHGQTTLSVEKRFSGHGDPPLTTAGRAQAADAARRLARVFADNAPALIVSSPLTRARETAAAVVEVLGGRVVIDERLIEADFGAWEGLTFAEIRESAPDELTAWLDSPDVAPPGGESFTSVATRVGELKDDWVAGYPGAAVLAITHVSPIKSLARIALDAGPSVLYRTHSDLCGISSIDWYSDGPASLRLWNSLT